MSASPLGPRMTIDVALHRSMRYPAGKMIPLIISVLRSLRIIAWRIVVEITAICRQGIDSNPAAA